MYEVVNNPFRMLGILANASAKDMLREKAKAERFANVGKVHEPAFYLTSLETLAPLKRSESDINTAMAQIEQRKNKLFHALFWFVNLTSFDDIAIEQINSQHQEKAFTTWKKLTENREITASNFSAFVNFSTLQLVSKDIEEQKKGVANKLALVNSFEINEFARVIIDDAFQVNKFELVDDILKSIIHNAKKSLLDEKHIFSLFTYYAKDECIDRVIKLFCQDHINKIENLLNNFECMISSSEKKLFLTLAFKLVNESALPLKKISAFIEKDNLLYLNLSDNIAKKAMSASFDYYNHFHSTNNRINLEKDVLNLLEIIKNLAIKPATKKRINDNISNLKETIKHKEKEEQFAYINNVIYLFRTEDKPVLNTEQLIHTCKTELQKIKSQYPNIISDEAYITTSNTLVFAVINQALSLIKTKINPEKDNQIRFNELSKLKAILTKLNIFDMSFEVKEQYDFILNELNKRIYNEQLAIKDKNTSRILLFITLGLMIYATFSYLTS